MSDQNFIIYGTPLIETAEEDKDELVFKKPVNVQDQIVTDDHGRRRFHGAFTGGFSAGFYNTVGTKEGWNPKSYVSSRDAQSKVSQKPEDFMDEEDFSEFGIAPKRVEVTRRATHAVDERTTSTFKITDLDNENAFDRLFQQPNEKYASIGLEILKTMGGRLGKGVGAKVIKKRLNSNRNVANEREKEKVKSADTKPKIDETAPVKVYGCLLPPQFKNDAKINNQSANNSKSHVCDHFEFLPDDVSAHKFVPRLDKSGLGYDPNSANQNALPFAKSTNQVAIPESSTALIPSSRMDWLLPSPEVGKPVSSVLSKMAAKNKAPAFALGTFLNTAIKKKKQGMTGQAFGIGAFEDSEDELEKAYDGEDDENSFMSKYDIPLFRDQGLIVPQHTPKLPAKICERKPKWPTTPNLHDSTEAQLQSFSLTFRKGRVPLNFGELSAPTSQHLFKTADRQRANDVDGGRLRHSFTHDQLIATPSGARRSRWDTGPNQKSDPPSKLKTVKGQNLSRERGNMLECGKESNQHNSTNFLSDTFLCEGPEKVITNEEARSLGPLYKPFSDDVRKQERFQTLLKNYQISVHLLSFSNKKPNRNFKQKLSREKIMSGRETITEPDKDILFRSLKFEGMTEWEIDKEKNEFLNLLRFGAIDSPCLKAGESDAFPLYNGGGGRTGQLLSKSLTSRFAPAGPQKCDVALEYESGVSLFGASEEEMMKKAVEARMFGYPMTRSLFEWEPCLLLSKRFGVRYMGVRQATEDDEQSSTGERLFDRAQNPQNHVAKPLINNNFPLGKSALDSDVVGRASNDEENVGIDELPDIDFYGNLLAKSNASIVKDKESNVVVEKPERLNASYVKIKDWINLGDDANPPRAPGISPSHSSALSQDLKPDIEKLDGENIEGKPSVDIFQAIFGDSSSEEASDSEELTLKEIENSRKLQHVPKITSFDQDLKHKDEKALISNVAVIEKTEKIVFKGPNPEEFGAVIPQYTLNHPVVRNDTSKSNKTHAPKSVDPIDSFIKGIIGEAGGQKSNQYSFKLEEKSYDTNEYCWEEREVVIDHKKSGPKGKKHGKHKKTNKHRDYD